MKAMSFVFETFENKMTIFYNNVVQYNFEICFFFSREFAAIPHLRHANIAQELRVAKSCIHAAACIDIDDSSHAHCVHIPVCVRETSIFKQIKTSDNRHIPYLLLVQVHSSKQRIIHTHPTFLPQNYHNLRKQQ